MGVRDDPVSVLDSRARVYGVDGLRVVDAGSFPLLPPGHPQSCIYKSFSLSLVRIHLTHADILGEK